MNIIGVILTVALGVLPSTPSRVEYTAAGGTQFTFTFKTFASSHVKVYKNTVLQSTGYSVTLNANQESSPGGTVTFTVAPVSGTVVRLERLLPITNDSAWTSFSSAKSLERDLDRAAMRDQQLQRQQDDISTGVLTAGDASGALVSSSNSTTPRAERDRWADTVNVLDFIPSNLHAGIAAKTDTTDLTSYINLAIGVAGPGRKVFFPWGRYHHTGVTLQYSVTLAGIGWNGAELRNIGVSSAGVTLSPQPGSGTPPDGYLVGGHKIEDLKLTGTSTGPAVLMNTQSHTILRNVYILGNAGDGIRISTDSHVYGLVIDHCIIQQNAGWGVTGYGNGNRQINAVRIQGGTEIAQNGLGGISIWPTIDFVVQDSIIEGHSGPGILVYADPAGVGTVNASAYGITIARNYLEGNAGGSILVKTTLAYTSPFTIHYLKGLRISGNHIDQRSRGAGVTAAVTLDCTNDAGAGCGEVTYQGVDLADNYVLTIGTIAFVDFRGPHHGRTTRLTPFYEAEALGALTSAQKYLNVGNVTVRDEATLRGSGPRASSAEFIGQTYLDQGGNTWYVAKSAGTGAADWQTGFPTVTQERSGVDRLAAGSALDGVSWTRINVTVDPDADGSAERIRVAEGVNAQVYQGESTTAGETFEFSFEAKAVGTTATAAKFLIWDVTHQVPIVTNTSYLAQINTSTYTRIVSRFTVPEGCTNVAVFPVGITTAAGETVDVYVKNAQMYLIVSGFLRFGSGSAVIASGQQTVSTDITVSGYTAAPYCTVSGVTANRAYKVTTTTTGLTIDAGAVLGGNETIHYTCLGK